MTLKTGPKNLFLRDPVRRGYAGEKTWRIPVTFARQFQPRLHEFRALFQAAVDQFADLIQLHPGVDGADVGIFVQGISNAPVSKYDHAACG